MPELFIVNKGRPSPIKPMVQFRGGNYGSTLCPKSFSLAAMKTMVRWDKFKERPLSKLISEQAGLSGYIGGKYSA